jgi:AraC-like DNA-binding protein
VPGPAEALRYFAPSPALARHVNLLFLWTGNGEAHADRMPAIEGQIAIRLRGDGRFRFNDGRVVIPAPMALIGPLSGSIHMSVGANFRSMGAGLTALGWQALAGLPAMLACDTILDLAAIWGDGPARVAHDRLVNQVDDDRAVATLDALLVDRLVNPSMRVDPRGAVVDRWLAADPTLSIAALGSALDLSPRQVARLTATTHGVSPKLLAMKHRALRAATGLATGSPRWIGEAAFGYADQSHMTRDFHRFIGATPRVFLDRAVSRHVFEEPERVGASLSRARFYDGPGPR